MRRTIVAMVAMSMVVVAVGAGRAVALPAPATPIGVLSLRAVDPSGRFVIVEPNEQPAPSGRIATLIDRLTGTRRDLGTVVLTDTALDTVVTSNAPADSYDWRDLRSGTSRQVPVDAAGSSLRPRALDRDGQLLLAQSLTPWAAVVVDADGEQSVAPITDVAAVDMSSNGRWVLLLRQEGPTSFGPFKAFRWDRVTGNVAQFAAWAGDKRGMLGIGDSGQVVEHEDPNDDPFALGPRRYVSRRTDGTIAELVASGTQYSGFALSADGGTLAYTVGQRLVSVSTLSGASADASFDGVVLEMEISGGGESALILRAGNPGFPTTADLLVTSVPGSVASPRIAAGETVAVPVAGVRNVPVDASAVVLNVTVTNPAAAGFVTVWPCDQVRPDASNVNFTSSGATVANAVIAKVAVSGPSTGSVCFSSIAATDLIVDVQGYFTGAGYSGLTPDRFADTRNGEVDAVGNIGAGGVVTVPVRGVRGVAADASAVVLNVTVTNPAGPGFVTVWPCDQVRPDASNVNFTVSGATVANAVIAKVAESGPSAGAVCLSPSTGADVIVDVQGYVTGSAYSGVTPDRFADTRNGEADAVGNVGAGGVVTVPVRGVRGVAADASAVVLNVTVTNTAGPGFVTVWPCDQVRPDASNVNFTSSGATVANAVVAKVAESGPSAGAVCLSPSTGADLIVDVQGAFTGSTYTGATPDRFFDSRG